MATTKMGKLFLLYSVLGFLNGDFNNETFHNGTSHIEALYNGTSYNETSFNMSRFFNISFVEVLYEGTN